MMQHATLMTAALSPLPRRCSLKDLGVANAGVVAVAGRAIFRTRPEHGSASGDRPRTRIVSARVMDRCRLAGDVRFRLRP